MYVFCRRFTIKLSAQVRGGVGNASEVKKFVTQRVPKAHFLQTPFIIVYQAQSGCRWSMSMSKTMQNL